MALAYWALQDLLEEEDEDLGEYQFTTGAGAEGNGECDLCHKGSYVDAGSLIFSEFDAGTQQCNNCGYAP